MKVFLVIAFLMSLTSTSSFGENLSDSWQSCKMSQDCIVIYRACLHIAANKDEIGHFKEPQIIFCNRLIDNRFEEFEANCIRNKCMLSKVKEE